MAAVASTSYLWVYLEYSCTQNALTTGSVIFSTTFLRYSTSDSILLTPKRVASGYSNKARMQLLRIYSILADQTSGQIFLKTPISPPATKCLWATSTFSMILKAMG